MLGKAIEKALNRQVGMEHQASQNYLAMACWCASAGLAGSAEFFYNQADEEREHMLKIVHYIDEAGGTVAISNSAKPTAIFKDIKAVVETAYKQEQEVTKSINKIVDLALKESDHQTNSFLSWFVDEQLEEEAQFRDILDMINLIGMDGQGLYMIDKKLRQKSTEEEKEA